MFRHVPASASIADMFSPAMEGLRLRGYGRSEFEVQQVKILNATSALAIGIAVRYKTDGQELERVGITYVLRKSDSDWKIAVMVLVFPAGRTTISSPGRMTPLAMVPA